VAANGLFVSRLFLAMFMGDILCDTFEVDLEAVLLLFCDFLELNLRNILSMADISA
jgi:hypothetical protein